MNGAKRLGEILGWMFGTFLFTGLISAMMYLVVKFVNPGEGVSLKLVKLEAAEEQNEESLLRAFSKFRLRSNDEGCFFNYVSSTNG
ncbi:hypothetical protein ABLO26_20375 [Neobacillus sp. 179-J 1A1 HS]|uniref:hypothetical protein n=1 Tax=Neobacillus driksii TaxID=3035913 RepID=UPI0035BBE9BF